MSSNRPTTVAVVVGGEPVERALASRLGPFDLVVAADSGLQTADELDLDVDIVVGDLDSVDPAALHRDGLTVERHPRAKDCTDIVLALDRAAATGAQQVVVISGGGGRLDHALANLLVLASPEYSCMQVTALVGTHDVAVVHDRYTTSAPAGTVVSLLAVGGPAHGVRTRGLRYRLDNETLPALSSRGVSNECAGGPITVEVRDGTLLLIRPHGETRDTRHEDGRDARQQDTRDARRQDSHRADARHGHAHQEDAHDAR